MGALRSPMPRGTTIYAQVVVPAALLFLVGNRASLLRAVSSPRQIHRAGVGFSTGTSGWCGSKPSALGPWDCISSFFVGSDLVVDLNACLHKFVKYIGEGDLVREGLFQFAIQALLEERDLGTFINSQDCC